MNNLLQEAQARLESMGVTADEIALSFAASKVVEQIKNYCNVVQIPEGLHFAAIDMICGEYLQQMQRLGKLEGFDTEAAVKSISEGDVSITFMDNVSAEDKLTAYIGSLLNHEKDLIAYRRLRW